MFWTNKNEGGGVNKNYRKLEKKIKGGWKLKKTKGQLVHYRNEVPPSPLADYLI